MSRRDIGLRGPINLDAPLGMEPPRPRRRIGLVVGGLGALAALAGMGILVARGDPRGGEPYAVAALPTPAVPRPGQPVDATPTGSLASAVTPAPLAAPPPRVLGAAEDEGSLENGVRVHRGTGGAPMPALPTPVVIDVTHQLDAPSKPHAAGSAGVKPPEAGPRIAIYVGGLGLDQGATQAAIDAMPAGVTLAFLPYAAPAAVATARAKGHEVLLQLPMENTGGGVPGPHALHPGAALQADLDWAMGRVSGYDGVSNLLGAPVTADPAAMTAVLKAAGGRNLFFLDDGTSGRSVAASLGARLNVAVAQADLVLDATGDPAVVRANLDALVGIARRKGQAIGMASGLPDHLPAIARFAADLANKNIALVPVGALARQALASQALAHQAASVATNTR